VLGSLGSFFRGLAGSFFTSGFFGSGAGSGFGAGFGTGLDTGF